MLNGALSTVAQGFRQVLTTIGNIPSRPAPSAFNEPDSHLTWLDRPPLDEYEAGVLNNLNIVRTAVASYQTETDAALRSLPSFATKPGDDDGNVPPSGSGQPVRSPRTSGPPLGGAPRSEPDELAFATTTPVRPRASAADRPGPDRPGPDRAASDRAGSVSTFASSGFGPIGHANEDAALADEQTQPVQEPGVRFRSPPSPAVYQPVIVAPNTEKTIFDVDGPVVPPVIGE